MTEDQGSSDNIVSSPEPVKVVADVTAPPPVQVDLSSEATAEPAIVAATPEPKPVVHGEVREPSAQPTPEPVKAEEKPVETKPDARDRYAELVDRALKKERLSYLKNLGINTEIMSDAHILALAPDVDVETPDGKIAIDEWRAKGDNERLFVKRERSTIDIDVLTADYKGTQFNTFPKELMISTLQRLAGKK